MTDEECSSLIKMMSVSQLESFLIWQGVLFHGKYGLFSQNTNSSLIVQILFFKGRRKANQQCYKGHGECDCTGLCRENC
jgi:hypothetical protein